MARLRSIKPSFFTNESLGELDPLARLLFIGSWTIADREGRLEDRPKRIKAELLPYDDCDPDALLESLAERGFIVRYQIGDRRIIQVVNFLKHQYPHIKEAESRLPAQYEHGASTVKEPGSNGASTVKAPPVNLVPVNRLSVNAPPATPPERHARAYEGDDVVDLDPAELAPQKPKPLPIAKAPNDWHELEAILAPLRGFTPRQAFWDILESDYAHTKPRQRIEGEKMASFLAEHKGRQCSTRFVLNWLDKVEARIEAPRSTATAAAEPVSPEMQRALDRLKTAQDRLASATN